MQKQAARIVQEGHERPDRELGLDPKVQFNGDAP